MIPAFAQYKGLIGRVTSAESVRGCVMVYWSALAESQLVAIAYLERA